MTTTSSSSLASSARHSAGPRWAVRLGAIGAGLVLNLTYVIVLTKIVGYDLKVPAVFDQPSQSIQIGAVIGASVVSGLVAWGFLALLERFVPQAAAVIWGVLAGVVLTGGMPYNGAGITASNQVLLGVMHLIVGAALIPAFVITSLRRR